MSDELNTPTDDDLQADTAAPEPEPQPTDDRAAKQAAGYRVRLRETEAERDQLSEQVTALRRTLVEQAIAGHGIKPAAVFAAGTTLEALLDDTGLPNPEAIKHAVDTATEELGIARKQHVPARGLRSGAAVPEKPAPTFADAFKPRER